MVQNQAENSLLPHSSANCPVIVSIDFCVILLAMNNISCPKKLSIRRVYPAVARFDSWQELLTE